MSDIDFTDCTDDDLAVLHVEQMACLKEVGFRQQLTTDINALADRELEVLSGFEMVKAIDAELDRRRAVDEELAKRRR